MDFGLRETSNAYVHAQIVLDISKTHFYHQFLKEKHAKSQKNLERLVTVTGSQFCCWLLCSCIIVIFEIN
jgi:hypothetical protein